MGQWPGTLIQKGQQDSWICISFSIIFPSQINPRNTHSIIVHSDC